MAAQPLSNLSSNNLAVSGVRPCKRKGRARNLIRAQVAAKGRCIPAEVLTVKRALGEGSYGQVFEGSLETDDGEQKIVLKRVKARVQGAQQMGEMEHLLNVYASRVAKGHCADFIGYAEVRPEEADYKLTQGLWLAWRYEGSKTIAYYLRRRDTLKVLADDLGVPVAAAVPTAMKHIFESLQAFHSAGLVHRDVKPYNLILAEDSRRLKLIDLGACADLRSGTNYVPDESILDPAYCPPEQYVLPTDAPHLAQTPLAQAISPMLWALHKPDRFDMWSAGLVLMQLAVPSLRLQSSLTSFSTALQRCNYDLDAWRASTRLRPWETEILDAEDGAGWDLAKALLRPRQIVVEDDGTVKFVSDQRQQRISASEALRHKFIKQANYREAPAPAGTAGTAGGRSKGGKAGGTGSEAAGTGSGGTTSGGSGSAMLQAQQMWNVLGGKLLDFEAQLLQQVSATEKQSAAVSRLRAEVAAGRVPPQALEKAERRLDTMRGRLNSLQDAAMSSANRFTNWMFGADKKQPEPVPQPPPPPPASTDMWQGLSDRLLTLQQRLLKQQSATEVQTFTVKKLRVEVQSGSADEEQLSRAERLLSKMQGRLASLQGDYMRAAEATVSAVGGKLGTGSTGNKTAEKAGSKGSGGVKARTSGRGGSSGQAAKAAAPPAKAGSAAAKKAAVVAAAVDKGGSQGRAASGAAASSSSRGAAAAAAATTDDADKSRPWWAAFGAPFSKQGSGSQSASAAAASTAPAAKNSKAGTSGGKAAAAAAAVPAKAASGTGGGKAVAAGGTTGAGGSPATASTSSMDEAGSTVTKWVYAGLKLTAFAARVANDVASSVKADAERVLQEVDKENSARKTARAAESSFLMLLREQMGWLTCDTSFQEGAEKLGGEERWAAVPEDRRPALFNGYMDGLRKREEIARKMAISGLKDLYKRAGATPRCSYQEVAGLAAVADPDVFWSIKDEALKKEAFAQLLVEMAGLEAARQAEEQAADEFRQLLAEVRGPGIGRYSTWPLVKPQVWRDARYLALNEVKRKELFQEYVSTMPEPLQPPPAPPAMPEPLPVAAAAPPAPVAVPEPVAEPVAVPVAVAAAVPAAAVPTLAVGGVPLSAEQIMSLLQEQARLREEYGRMQEKLADMESRMNGTRPMTQQTNGASTATNGNGAAAAEANAPAAAAAAPEVAQGAPQGGGDGSDDDMWSKTVDLDEDGSLIFRFDDPSADRALPEAVNSVSKS